MRRESGLNHGPRNHSLHRGLPFPVTRRDGPAQSSGVYEGNERHAEALVSALLQFMQNLGYDSNTLAVVPCVTGAVHTVHTALSSSSLKDKCKGSSAQTTGRRVRGDVVGFRFKLEQCDRVEVVEMFSIGRFRGLFGLDESARPSVTAITHMLVTRR